MRDNHQNMMSRNNVVSVKAAIYWQGTCKLQKFLPKASQRHDIIYGVVALAVLKKSINATKISWFAQLSICLHEPVFAGKFKVSFARLHFTYSAYHRWSIFLTIHLARPLELLTEEMGLSKIVISLILICAAFNVATLFPKLQLLLNNVLIILRSWLPSVIDLVEEIAVGLHKYCTERLLEDIKKGFTILTGLFSSVFTLIQPAVGNVFKVITDALIAFHNNGMGYTDEILQQLLGIDGKDCTDPILNLMWLPYQNLA